MSEGNTQNVAKQKDGVSNDRGIIYEKRLCLLFAVRAYIRGLRDFQLRYQVPEKEVGKFDDIVFDEGQKVFQVFQLKHREDEKKHKISIDELISKKKKDDFYLFKYIKSLKDILSNDNIKNKIERAVVFTNIDFEFQNDENNVDSEILHPLPPNEYVDKIFDTSKYFKRAQKGQNEELDQIEDQAKKPKYYKFKANKIISELKLFPEQENMEHIEKKLKTNNEVIDFCNALNLIIYAVNQPNDTELEKIIKEEIMEYFQMQNVDTVYNAFEKAFIEWCSRKVQLNDPSSSSEHQIIGYEDVDIFFKNNVKKISFGVTAPSTSFTGRLDELKNISEKLKKQHNLVISQLAITGLGGMGKTELTKQFIAKYGQSDFYGRVIWIEAENDNSVKNCFQRLAEKVGISDKETKSLFTIIDKVFAYFCGVKVLFVFDNFDKNTEGNEVNSGNNEEKNFVIYCRKRASGLPKEDRPYFIFTSRNRNCLPGVASLDLSVLTNEDAQQLITRCVKNSTKEEVGNLAKRLQNFPLALKQATAYINEQNEIKSVTGGRYEIQNYLNEFDKKTEELLKFEYNNDFNENEKTTLVTWNVTLDAIKKDKKNGEDAIHVLQIISYLYADKIEPTMFLPLFNNDEIRCGKSFLLLDKYSLITKIENRKFYQIHRLVQAVVQLKFKKNEEETLNETWKFVNLKMYEKFLTRKQNTMEWCIFDDFTLDQILHYKNLSTYMKNYKNLKENFREFLDNLSRYSSTTAALYFDNVERIKELKLSKEFLKRRAEELCENMINVKRNKVIIYLIENGYLDFNDEMLLQCLECSEPNPDLFKYFVEKFESKLTILSTEFICDIKEGEQDSLLELIESEKSETNVRKLKESLFFASLYDEESIVQLLIDNNFTPDYKMWNINYAPIFVAGKFGYSHIVKILLKHFDKVEFWNDILQFIFEFFKLFADINSVEQGDRNYTNLYYAKNFNVKVKIAYNLLYQYKYYPHPIISTKLMNSIDTILNDSVKNTSYKNIITKMRLNVTQCEFITSLVKSNIDDQILDKLEMLKHINHCDGETQLISCVRDLTLDYVDTYRRQVYTVKTIVEENEDENVYVNATDRHGNNALYYAVDLYRPIVFKYLLPKTNSMHEKILLKAIKVDKIFCVKSLLETHFSHDHIFSDKKSLLEVAKENNSFKVVNYLLILSKFNENIEMGLINYVKHCITYGYFGDKAYIALLLKNGVKVNTLDSEQHNALYYSLYVKHSYFYSYSDLFSFLLEKGSLVHEETLERAIKLDNKEIVKKIIPLYFNKNHYLNKHGCSLFDFAKRCNAIWVKEFLSNEN